VAQLNRTQLRLPQGRSEVLRTTGPHLELDQFSATLAAGESFIRD
jgi:hypothetical protein